MSLQKRSLVLILIVVCLSISGLVVLMVRRGNPPISENGEQQSRLTDLVAEAQRDTEIAEASANARPNSGRVEPQPWTQGRYVGAAACAGCHEERVDDFVHTSHYQTSRLPELASLEDHLNVAGDLLSTRDASVRFQMSIRDGQLYQVGLQSTDQSEQGETRQEHPVGMVYGAGDFDEDYFYWDDDQLFQMPVVFQNGKQCWTNAPGYMDGRVEFRRPVAPRCLECHSTWVNHVSGTPNTYHQDGMILGVSCERCHGPGEFHVDYHREHPESKDAYCIAMPADMTRTQQMDLCAQCHSNANKRRTAPFSYRPGDPLEDHFRVDLNNHPEEDHTSNQHRYVQESKCFQASDSMTCVTCHDPHLPRELAREMAIESCAQCHKPVDCGEHSLLPVELQTKCVDCHMPYKFVNNITFDLADDQYVPIIRRHEHRIAVYPDASKLTQMQWLDAQGDDDSRKTAAALRLELVNQKRQEADDHESTYRFLAAAGAMREWLQLEESAESRERLERLLQKRRDIDQMMAEGLRLINALDYPSAIQQFETVVSQKPNHAAAHGKLGLLLIETGQVEDGIAHLEKVAQIDPDNGYGHALLGYFYLTKNDLQKARDYYLLAEECEPYNAKIKRYLGQVAYQNGRLSEAEGYWRQTLEIEPQNLEVLSTMINFLTERRSLVDAVLLVEQCVKRTQRTDPQLLAGLADLYLQVGRTEMAREALQDARSVTSDDETLLRESIDRALQQWGGRP